MTALRYPTERLHDPRSDRAQCSAPLPPPRCGWWRRRRRGLGGLRPVVLWWRVHRGVDAAPVVGVIVAVGGKRRGGGREARVIPGRGEENEYRGRKVQGGVEVDEAQHGGRKRMAAASAAGPPVPGAGDELGRGGRRRWPGTGRPLCGCPPVAFQRGVSPPDGAWGLRSRRIGVN